MYVDNQIYMYHDINRARERKKTEEVSEREREKILSLTLVVSFVSLSRFLPSHRLLPPSLVLLPQDGMLPLHRAAVNKAEVGVVEALLKAYPAAAQVKDRVCVSMMG